MNTIRKIFFAACIGLFACMPVFADSIDINSADVVSLADALTGVGEAKARAIVAYREQNGPFQSVNELTEVKGIGEKIVEANLENMKVIKTAE